MEIRKQLRVRTPKRRTLPQELVDGYVTTRENEKGRLSLSFHRKGPGYPLVYEEHT